MYEATKDGMYKFFHRVGYCPSPAQDLVHKSDKRFRVVAAGARFGKSLLAGLEAAYLFMLQNKRIWIIGTQYELAEKEFGWALEFLSRIELPNGYRVLDVCSLTNSSRGSRTLSGPWGSFIKTKSTEKPQSLLGEELDLAILSEASRHSKMPYYRMIRPRLGPRNGSLLAISTPNSDGGLFSELYEMEAKGKEGWQSWQFSVLDNPYFSREEYETAKKELSEENFKEQYEGLFISRRGLIFGMTEDHLLDNVPYGYENDTMIVGIHGGYKNPLSVVFVSLSRDKRYYVVDEIYSTFSTLSEIAPQIRQKTNGMKFGGVLVDPFDEGMFEECRKAGLLATRNDDEKKSGSKTFIVSKRIQTLQNLLKFRGATENRLFFVKSRCPKTIDCFKSAKWPEVKDEEDKMEREVPNSKLLQAPFALSHVVTRLEPLMRVG